MQGLSGKATWTKGFSEILLEKNDFSAGMLNMLSPVALQEGNDVIQTF